MVYPRSRASNIFKSPQAQNCRRFCTGSYKGYEGSLCPDSWERTAQEPRLSDPPATNSSHRTGRRWRSSLDSHGKACSRRCRLLWSTMGMPGVCFVLSYFEQRNSAVPWAGQCHPLVQGFVCVSACLRVFSLFSLSLQTHTHSYQRKHTWHTQQGVFRSDDRGG